MEWKKADLNSLDNMPLKGVIRYYIKYNDGKDSEIGNYWLIRELLINGWQDVYYLDETTPAQSGDRTCPCLYLDEPCHDTCTCKNGFSSFGCMYCCTYGSIEQRKNNAKRIAEKLKSTPSQSGEELKVHLDKLFLECEHGDEQHRKWLKDKFNDYLKRQIK